MANDDQSNLQVTSSTNLASSPSQILCHRCKTPIVQNAQYCKQCGDLLGERQCKDCNKQNDRDAKYCKYCGKQLQTLYYCVARQL